MQVNVMIKIESGNAAFGETVPEAIREIAQVLRQAQGLLVFAGSTPDVQATLRDTNGNPVGQMIINIEEDDE